MKVILPEELFSPVALRRQPLLLQGLFEACMRSGHEVVLGFEEEQSIPFAEWKEKLQPDHWELVDLVLQSSTKAEARETIYSEIIVSDRETNWAQSPPRIGPNDHDGAARAVVLAHHLHRAVQPPDRPAG